MILSLRFAVTHHQRSGSGEFYVLTVLPSWVLISCPYSNDEQQFGEATAVYRIASHYPLAFSIPSGQCR